jgi:membrane-bound lytic murein transglycosylase F
VKYIVTLLVGLFLTFCSREPTLLEQVKERGELKVVARNDPTSIYQGPGGRAGLEYDLARRFARELGVELRLMVVQNPRDLLPGLAATGAQLAAGVIITDDRKPRVRFGPTYQQVTQQVVYRVGTRRPRGIEDLASGNLEVAKGSYQSRLLEQLKRKHPELEWQEVPEVGPRELLSLVWDQLVDYTIADSNEVALVRRFYPELRIAFDLGSPIPLAWAFPRDADDSLYLAAIHFFNRIRKNGELEQLLERHYGHVNRFDYVGTRRLLLHLKQRLPRYRTYFRQAAARYGLDWKLIAAIGYQESHWDPDAVSPTQVRGLMMLTLKTARQLGIKDRRDPKDSIYGGAKYFAMSKAKVPGRIPEPDRTWFGLAAYNVGYGHLEDARRLTQRLGDDPDKWVDVKKHLPLLSEEKWYKKTRYGYARGQEPVRYVENVRRYYDLIVWAEQQDQPQPPPPPPGLGIDSPVL